MNEYVQNLDIFILASDEDDARTALEEIKAVIRKVGGNPYENGALEVVSFDNPTEAQDGCDEICEQFGCDCRSPIECEPVEEDE